MKIGIMGGTFDPIHNGHIHIALAAYKEYGLNSIWFMPAGDPYFKQGQGVSSPADRFEMTRLAVADYPDSCVCSDIEIRAEGHTYTAETLLKLHELYPAHEFYFIIGYDSLKSLALWYHPEIIFRHAVILCALRDGCTLSDAELVRLQIIEQYTAAHPDIRFIHTPLMDVSSTMIRDAVRRGQEISQYVPEAVAAYIKRHRMYKRSLSTLS